MYGAEAIMKKIKGLDKTQLLGFDRKGDGLWGVKKPSGTGTPAGVVKGR